MIQTIDDLKSLLAHVRYLDWEFPVSELGDGYCLQVQFIEHENEGKVHRGRKWYISRHATRSEVVQTALLAVLTAVEHEAREYFMFDGAPLFHPHHSIEGLQCCVYATDARPPIPEAAP